MDDHGDLIHILAIGQTTPRGKATSIVELTSASVSSASGSACSYGFSMCRRKCRRSELYADREDSRVRGHEAVSTLSKSRKAFQQAERRPLLGAEMWPSRRTASLSSASDGYCWSSCQLCLASARRLIADESVSIGLGTSVLLALCRNSRTLVLKWGGGMGGLARRRSRRRLAMMRRHSLQGVSFQVHSLTHHRQVHISTLSIAFVYWDEETTQCGGHINLSTSQMRRSYLVARCSIITV